MGREYAVILSLIAFVAINLRGAVQGTSLESTIGLSLIAMIIFAAIGGLAGTIAKVVMDEALKTEIQGEWERVRENAGEGAAEQGSASTSP